MMTAIPQSSSLKQNLTHLVWLLLVVLIFAISASWLDPALAWPLGDAGWSYVELIGINILPFVLIVGLLSALSRRVVLSSWIGLLLLVGSYAANAVKLQQLEMPLLPADFHFLEEIGSALPLFAHYIGTSFLPLLIAVALLALTLALFREAAWPMMRGWARVGVAVVTLALGIGIVQGWAPWRSVYSADRLAFEPWSVVDSARKAGMVGNLVLYNWELAKRQELRPDRNAARELVRANVDSLRKRLSPNTSSLAMPSGSQPDIVIIQSESLFDPARLKGAPQNTYLPNFHRLAKTRPVRRDEGADLCRRHHPHRVRGADRPCPRLLPGRAVSVFRDCRPADSGHRPHAVAAGLPDHCNPSEQRRVLESQPGLSSRSVSTALSTKKRSPKMTSSDCSPAMPH